MEEREPLRSRLTGDQFVPRYEAAMRELAANHAPPDDDLEEWVLDLDEVIYVWQAQRDRRDGK